MNRQKVEEKVKHIQSLRRDPEAAHVTEDDLLWEFVCYVAELGGELGETAQEILKSRDLDFPRWCA